MDLKRKVKTARACFFLYGAIRLQDLHPAKPARNKGMRQPPTCTSLKIPCGHSQVSETWRREYSRNYNFV